MATEATATGAENVGLNRLAVLGRKRAAEVGRTSPSDADMDWLVKQAKPAEVATWGTPQGFAVIEKSFAGAKAPGTEKTEGTMAKKKPGIGARIKAVVGIGKKSKPAARRTATGAAAPKSAKSKGAPPKKKGVIARAGGAVKRVFGFGKKPPPKRKSGGGGAPAFGAKRTVAVSVPTASGNLGLHEAKLNPTTGVYELESPKGGAHAIVPHNRSGGGFGGGALVSGKGGGGMGMLTLGLSVLGGGGLGMLLQTQPAVPIFGIKVRRAVLAVLAGIAVTVATRKRFPRIARHVGGFTLGIATGATAETVGVKRGHFKDVLTEST